jgi:formylglycine-generating enzyme required for sulfatase activity
MSRLKTFLILLPVLAVLPLFGQTKPRLAILPFTGGTGGDGETIAELFSYEQELSQVFTIVPRTSTLEAVMQEHQFQRSAGLTDADTIARLGRQYNADYVVAGHIRTLGVSKLVLITIIHVESLRQIAGDYREYKEIEEVQPLIPDMAKRIVAASKIDARSLPRLAVLPFAAPEGVDQSDAEVLAQLLAAEIANSGRYAVLPRTSSIQQVMEEHRIQRSGITDPGSIKAIGNALNARFVLAGSVRSLGRANIFTASILNIEDASQVTGSAVNYQTIGDGLKVMEELGGRIAESGAATSAPANMVYVEGGIFQMGSTKGDSNERPVHAVTVKSFYMGKYEVTQKEWEELMGVNPSRFKGDNLPVEQIAWYEAVEYCNKLSLKEGLTPAYQGSGDDITCDFSASGYRLPTEAEWEYAAKGGNKDPVVFEYSGANNAGNVGWYDGNSGGRTHPVGTKQPNSLGLYDMSGNVWEWCWDWYSSSYPNETQTNPAGPSGPTPSGALRVGRGGSWSDNARNIRSSSRNYGAPSYKDIILGFRLVRP